MATLADTIRAHAHTSDKRDDVWDEGSENGKWAVLKPGFKCVHSDCHTCHESTWTRLLAAVRDAQPCDCDECCAALVSSWKPEVLAQGQWTPNAVRFATKAESDGFLFDLGMRWFGFDESRSVPCDDPVTHVWVDGKGKRGVDEPEGSERFMPTRVQL